MTATTVYTSETPSVISVWCGKCWHYATLTHVCMPCCEVCCGNCGECRFPTASDPGGTTGPVVRGRSSTIQPDWNPDLLLRRVREMLTAHTIPDPTQIHIDFDGVIRCQWAHPDHCWTTLIATPTTFDMFHVTGNDATERSIEHAVDLDAVLVAFADVFADALPTPNGPTVTDWRG